MTAVALGLTAVGHLSGLARVIVAIFAGLPAGMWVLLARATVRPPFRIAATVAVGVGILAAALYLDDLPNALNVGVLFALSIAGLVALNAFVRHRPSWPEVKAALTGAASREEPVASEPEPGSGSGGEQRFGDDESVKQCLEIMREVLPEQRARARHLDTKAGALAGFCATALTLNVTLGRPLLQERFSDSGETAVAWFFGVAIAALALAATLAVLGVMRPMGHDDLTEEQIDQYSDRPKVTTPPEDLRMTWLRTLTCMAISDRSAGTAKSRWSTAAVGFLVVGVLALSGEAATLLIEQ